MSERRVSLQLIDPARPASHADVENCYRLFLARGADAQCVVTDKAGLALLPIVVSFLLSAEFAQRIALADAALAIDEAMLLALEPDLMAWLETIAAPADGNAATPPDRLAVIAALLRDERLAHAVEAEGKRDDAPLRAAFAAADDAAGVVEGGASFDPAYYRALSPAGVRIARPAHHYVLLGERRGLAASATFDAALYAGQNPDVAASDINRLVHYETCGRREGRRHRDWLIDHALPPVAADSDRPTVLLLLHDASYTGAPILGWNLAGALAPAVVAAPPPDILADPAEMARFAERLAATYRPLYAIANSVESAQLAIPLRHHDVPIVALIHEFWPGARPGVRLDFYAACAALVFPARIVEQSSLHAFRETGLQNRFILPQGPCTIPPFDPAHAPRPCGAPFVDPDAPTLAALLADGARGDGPFTVIGLGAVEPRKGVDLFVAAATALHARHPDLDFRFVWIGTWAHAIGSAHALLLDEQQRRADLGDRLHFFPAVDDLDPIYARADALLLSSRLDPLPNITIDAACRGLPVICFERASGIAELMAADPGTASLVVPHLDSGAAAERIAALAHDADDRAACGAALQALARRTFDMPAYAAALDAIGRAAAAKADAAVGDRALIEQSGIFDPALYFGPDRRDMPPPDAAVDAYLDATRHLNFAARPVGGVIPRRPSPGFHPFVYGMEAPDFPRDGSRDPLAHYVERDRPAGRWTHRVLRPDLAAGDADAAGAGRIALHGHFHYPDAIGELLTALAANRMRADLFLTTTSDAAADLLGVATRDYAAGDVRIDVGRNVGRDIHSFLRVLGTHLRGRYDIVGHVHGKRSVDAQGGDPDFGVRWRRFLWAHLLGPDVAAADTILAAFAQDPSLGLVFPENGYLVGWEKNDVSAALLARRLGLRAPLPAHIEFPAGTMFWARVAALEALVAADLDAAEMPPEPVPIDGTILHAFERMLPLVCAQAGYGYATSYIPHLGR